MDATDKRELGKKKCAGQRVYELGKRKMKNERRKSRMSMVHTSCNCLATEGFRSSSPAHQEVTECVVLLDNHKLIYFPFKNDKRVGARTRFCFCIERNKESFI